MFGNIIAFRVIMQNGKGVADIGVLYRNPIYFQRGAGFGLGGLFLGLSKYLIPVLKKTGEALGKQAIKSGKGIIADMANTAIGRSNKNLRQILSDQGSEAINDLSNKAIKGLKRKLSTQIGSGRPPKRIKAARTVKNRRSVSSSLKHKRCRRVSKKKVVKKSKRVVKKKRTIKRKSEKRSKKRILDIFE